MNSGNLFKRENLENAENLYGRLIYPLSFLNVMAVKFKKPSKNSSAAKFDREIPETFF